MPCVKTLLQPADQNEPRFDDDNVDDDDNEDLDAVQARENPEDIPLWLPSTLSHDLRRTDSVKALLKKERDLCIAQADDVLADIRRVRRIMSGISQFKKLNVSGTGQKANTRIRNLYSKFVGKQTAAAAKYRSAFEALKVLDPGGEWSSRLKPLLSRDLHGPGRDEDGDGPLGEGYHEPSWIWLTSQITPNDGDQPGAEEFNASMRAEWAKTRARARRWSEEVALLQEEMRRVLTYFDWKAAWWRSQGPRYTAVNLDIRSGLCAYAEKQCAMYKQLALKYREHWRPLLAANGFDVPHVPHPDNDDLHAPTCNIPGHKGKRPAPSSDLDRSDIQSDSDSESDSGSDIDGDDL